MLEALPQILTKFPNCHVYTTGKNPLQLIGLEKIKCNSYNKYLGFLIKKYNLQNNVTFLGNLNENQMCERYLKSHIFVSASSIENSPNSMGEAMILGVPTITSDVGGVKNLITHNQDGFIYQSDAPYMLSFYINQIFESSSLARKFSQNGRIHGLANHDRKHNLDQMLSIYREVSN